MLKGFSHVMLYVQDVDRAAKWYQQHLGFKPRQLYAPHYGILFHDGMKFRLDLHPAKPDSDNIGHGPLVYFTCDDLDATVAALRGAGVSVQDPRSEGGSPRFTEFKDGEGNVLGLM
jgi:catechol 2,3-dioxygenase-like lactoylglutathione lyase family enzyme